MQKIIYYKYYAPRLSRLLVITFARNIFFASTVEKSLYFLYMFVSLLYIKDIEIICARGIKQER